MKKNKNNDFLHSQMPAVKAAQKQLDLVNSIQPRLDIANSIPQSLNLISAAQPQLVAAASVQSPGVFSASIVPFYEKPAILQSIEPFLASHEEIARSFCSIPHYYVESPAFSALAMNVSNLVRGADLPIQQLHASSQSLADALQHRDDIASIFASNIENITISSEPESDSFIDLPESVAKMFSDMDDSIELPSSSSDQIIRIDKTNLNTFIAVLGLLVTILSLFFGIVSDISSTALSKQQHAERMRQDEDRHKELMHEERKQTELLEKICDALDSMLNGNESTTEDIHKCTPDQPTSEWI